MAPPIAFIEVTSGRGKAARFLPAVEHSLWHPLRHAGLPANWRLRLFDTPEFEEGINLPILFDCLGPVDPVPLVGTWLSHGYLAWDMRGEVVRACALANGALARVLEERFSLVDLIPADRGGTEITCPVLQSFARQWEAYEMAAARLAVAGDRLKTPYHWVAKAHTLHAAWEAYLCAVRTLKETCNRLLEDVEAGEALAPISAA